MIRTRSLAASLLSLSAVAMIALVGAGGAHAGPSASDDKSPVASAAVDSSGAADYWTSDRMRAAIPGDVLAARALERGNTSSVATVEKGTKTQVKAAKGKPALHQNEDPVSHIGKVFFTMGETDYVCSGNAVTSANKSTVATAGHCIHESPGHFATNFVFSPAYDDGHSSYGVWTARKLLAPDRWVNNGDVRYDTGFAVMKPRADGALLTEVVGGSGVEFNAPRGLQYTAYGYPATSPFTGQTLISCTGTATDDRRNPQFNSQGIPCDMTGGSSGGPWFIKGGTPDSTGSHGLQNSVNSYGYSGGSARMYGPFWGAVIQATYTSAARA